MTEKNVANNAIGKGGRVKLPSLVIVNESTTKSKETCMREFENCIFWKKGNLHD